MLSQVSVVDFLHLGSSLSLRHFASCSSALAVFGAGRYGATVSVLDFVKPTPATHAILTVLKAGETVYQMGETTYLEIHSELPKTL